MRTFLCAFAVVSLASFSFAQDDACALLSKEEVTKFFGELKEAPKVKEGLRKEKLCEWTNVSGAWLTIGLFDVEKWEMKKGGANNPVDVKGLGDEAFSDRRGTDAEFYVRNGQLMVEVRTSGGAELARKVAELMLKKLP